MVSLDFFDLAFHHLRSFLSFFSNLSYSTASFFFKCTHLCINCTYCLNLITYLYILWVDLAYYECILVINLWLSNEIAADLYQYHYQASVMKKVLQICKKRSSNHGYKNNQTIHKVHENRHQYSVSRFHRSYKEVK